MSIDCPCFSDRYAEQVLPILVQAQRQLVNLLADLGGEGPPQKHYRELMQRLGGVVTSKDYLTTQLTLVIDPNTLPHIPPGAAIDPLGHGIYTGIKYKNWCLNLHKHLNACNSFWTVSGFFDFLFLNIKCAFLAKDGQKSVSVPLDVPLSLQTLREVLDKSQYTCRALHHSRKLLILYLAGQQNSKSVTDCRRSINI